MTCQVASRVLCSEGPSVSVSLLCGLSRLAWYSSVVQDILLFYRGESRLNLGSSVG
jgi:hypothetical protein